MIPLLQLLFHGHIHRWEFVRYSSEPDPRDKDLSIVYRIYACKRCGVVKRVRV